MEWNGKDGMLPSAVQDAVVGKLLLSEAEYIFLKKAIALAASQST